MINFKLKGVDNMLYLLLYLIFKNQFIIKILKELILMLALLGGIVVGNVIANGISKLLEDQEVKNGKNSRKNGIFQKNCVIIFLQKGS